MRLLIVRALPLFFLVLLSTNGFAKKINLLPSYKCTTIQSNILQPDAVQTAFAYRDDLRSYDYTKKRSKIDERKALAKYLPQVSVNVNKAYTVPYILQNPETYEIIRCPEHTSEEGIAFHLQQPIFTGGKPLAEYRIAKEGTKIVQYDRQTAANSIQLSVETAFLETQKLFWKNKFIATKDATAKKVFEQSDCYKKVGFLNETEWQSAITTYAFDRTDVVNHEREKINALSKLQREIGVPVCPEDLNLSLQNIEHIELAPLEYYLGQALKNRPELKKQKHSARQARWQEKRFALSYIPDVNVYARAQTSKLREFSLYNTSSWEAGLEVNWSFDGLSSAHTSQQYKNLEVEIKLQKKDLELKIEKDVKITYEQIKISQNGLKSLMLALKQQETNLKLKESQYCTGLISEAELAQAKLSYEETVFDLTSTKIDINAAYQNLLFLCGYPKEKNDAFAKVIS